LDLTAEAEDDLVLAVSEAGSNVIDHAYRTPEVAAGIELFFWTEPAVCSPSRSSIMAGGSLPARTRRAVGWTST
jgi:hypothetical protein